MHKARFFLAATFIVLATSFVAQKSYTFDISAYWDPVSMVQLEGHGASGLQDCQGDTDLSWWLQAVGPDNNQVLHWYQDMGITNLCVHYRPSDFTDYLGTSGESLAVMNERWPERMYQYLEAQGIGRRAEVADTSDPYVDSVSWGVNTTRELSDISPQIQDVQTLAIGPGNGTVQEFFRPAVGFDTWNGWARREFSDDWRAPDSTLDYIMPLNFRLVLDYEPDTTASSHEIAKFYWYFKRSDGQWLRYYPYTILTDSIQHQAGRFDTLMIRIDPIDYTCVRHDTLCDSLIYICSSPFDWDPSNSLDMDFFGPADVSWEVREGRFEIRYSGNHTLYVYSVEVMDDAYYRMFEAHPDSVEATETMIVNAFTTEKNRWPYMKGWYYDEIRNNAYLKPWVHVNKILHAATPRLPTFFINGYAFDDDRETQMDLLYEEFDLPENGGIRPQTFMYETYYFNGDSEAVTKSWHYPPFFGTRYDSDEPYLDSTNGHDTTWYEDKWWPTVRQFDGSQSLQRAIDWTYWRVPNDMVHPLLSNDQWTRITEMELYPGFIEQVRLQHDRGTKMWALLQAGGQIYQFDSTRIAYSRNPSPQEIKLEAWMAVASDADGIMWYWGTPTPGNPAPIGGIFEWSTSNFCTPGGASVITTNRYTAAAEVDWEIRRVAPTLDPLLFVKTYASRAFEHNYPYSGNEATWTDTLATNTYGNGDSIRSVYRISAFKPDTTEPGEWLENAESHPYVQVSRFRNPVIQPNDPAVEDYWFLIVNRRALINEQRKIRVAVETDTAYTDYPYYAERILGEGTDLLESDPAREDNSDTRFIDVILEPGEAELVHFFRGALGCDTTMAQFDSTLAHIHQLTVSRYGASGVKLRWETVTEDDDGLPFEVTGYIVWSSSQSDGSFAPIAVTTDTTYVDYPPTPRRYYNVQTCGQTVVN